MVPSACICGTPMFLTAALPVLVVSDGTLWVSDYSDDGVVQGEPTQVMEATLFVGRTYTSLLNDAVILSHLHVYTRTGMENFLEKISARASSMWDDVFPAKAIKRAMAAG